MKPTIGLIDYGSGNLRSVGKALEHIGAQVKAVDTGANANGFDAMVLPGVGAFGDCVRQLKERALWEPCGAWVTSGKPFLGICLGYQVLFESSEECPGIEGLGIFKGPVTKFDETQGIKVPHMGWNSLEIPENGKALSCGLEANPFVYFVHSFRPEPADVSLVAAWCDYGGKFAAAIACGSVFATQFHPEKSQATGLTILTNFMQSI